MNALDLPALVEARDVEVIASNAAAYGFADDAIKDDISLMATKEGLIADPVYEGRAVCGLLDLNASGRFAQDDKFYSCTSAGPRPSTPMQDSSPKFGSKNSTANRSLAPDGHRKCRSRLFPGPHLKID